MIEYFPLCWFDAKSMHWMAVYCEGYHPIPMLTSSRVSLASEKLGTDWRRELRKAP
jgi:hypothetical protein